MAPGTQNAQRFRISPHTFQMASKSVISSYADWFSRFAQLWELIRQLYKVAGLNKKDP